MFEIGTDDDVQEPQELCEVIKHTHTESSRLDIIPEEILQRSAGLSVHSRCVGRHQEPYERLEIS